MTTSVVTLATPPDVTRAVNIRRNEGNGVGPSQLGKARSRMSFVGRRKVHLRLLVVAKHAVPRDFEEVKLRHPTTSGDKVQATISKEKQATVKVGR